jgi:hypothetical protein
MTFVRRIRLHVKEYKYSIVAKFELYLTCYQAVGMNLCMIVIDSMGHKFSDIILSKSMN